MKRGFTLTEILVVISILMIAAAISYPAFVGVRRSANRSACISNLRQIGVALALYREAENGADQGTSPEMGLPPDMGPLIINRSGQLRFKCRGNRPDGNVYTRSWPEPFDSPGQQEWARYVTFAGSASIVILDSNHQHKFPRSITWESWTMVGLRIDGGVIVRTRFGYPLSRFWWHD